MKKQTPHAHPEKLKLYEKLVSEFPEVEQKGDTMPYTSLNGNMFSYISKEGVVAIRLPEKERDAFLKKYNAKLMEAYGIVQKEYVTVPENLLSNTKALKKYFAISFKYASSLKAKPTTKKKK